MSENPSQKLIIISGSSCVGKTTAAQSLLYMYENSAHLDDDQVWMVNPFDFNDPRNRIGYQNMSFVLSSYLNAGFDYVIFSSVRNRTQVLKGITAKGYSVIGFTLTCTEETLVRRHTMRGDAGEVSFEWLRREPFPGDFVIHTDDKTAAEIAEGMKSLMDGLGV